MADHAFCNRCNRAFPHDTVLIHENRCKHRNSSRRPSLNKKTVTSKKEKLERPRTSSISRSNNGTHLVQVLTRLCFVCGKKIEEEVKSHEENCFKAWSTSVKRLSKKFDLCVPERLSIPSVDGTQDISRLNEHAALQSAQAQIAHCKRCHAQIPIHEAVRHKCMRFDPPVEFFF